MLYIAIGILGATVMPHNLYLHSAIVQTRDFDRSHEGRREAIRYSVIDSTVALTFALLVNAAILIVSAATFYRHGFNQVAEIQDAHKLPSPLLGVTGASTVFALALLASGQNSTLTGTFGRTGGNGRLPQHPPAPLAAASDYAQHCHRSRHRGYGIVGRKGHRGPADLQPGHSKHAVELRRLSIGDVHQ
jgi:Natural resistance-associated macrophage protein